MTNDAYGIIEVIRKAIGQETKSGAKIEYSYGEIVDASSGYIVSAYLNGNYDSVSEDFRVPGHLHVNTGDYAMFATDHGRGSKWIVEVLPTSLYAKIAMDINSGEILTGDGAGPPSTVFEGGGGGSGNIDGGDASETYGGTTAIDGGSA